MFVVVDEGDYHERFLLPEGMSRSTCSLTILSFQQNQTATSIPTSKNVIDDLVNDNLVEQQDLDNLKVFNFIQSADDNDKESSFPKKLDLQRAR